MDPALPLDDLLERYVTHHRARNHSPNTILRYRHSLRLFARFLESTGTAPDTAALTTVTMRGFVVWLRDEPVRGRRGATERKPAGVANALQDLRAFTR